MDVAGAEGHQGKEFIPSFFGLNLFPSHSRVIYPSLRLFLGEKGTLVKRVSYHATTKSHTASQPSESSPQLLPYLCVTQSQPNALTSERSEGLVLQ